jgi:acyl CoA:acetate/3-ketoacid CoA transferase alpha subunit
MDKVLPNLDAAYSRYSRWRDDRHSRVFSPAAYQRALLQALIKKGTKKSHADLRMRPSARRFPGTDHLVEKGSLKKLSNSYAACSRSASKGMSDPFEQAIRAGKIELEVYPMGTMAEKYRAGGAGIPAFYTPTGVGSVVEETVVSSIEANRVPKETKIIDGQKYVLEYALKPVYAFIHAFLGDAREPRMPIPPEL